MVMVRVRDKEAENKEDEILLRNPVDAREIVTHGKGRFELADDESAALVPGLVPPPVTKPEGDALNVKIMAAIPKLDATEGFNTEGEPSLFALTALLGYAVTAEERDTGWMDFQLANETTKNAAKPATD